MASKIATTGTTAKSGRKCLCSPTSHPGSFRCNLHRSSSTAKRQSKPSASQIKSQWEKMSPAAKAKSLKAFLLQIIKPSKHDIQRRRDFHPKPSRFFTRHGSGSDGVAVS